MLALARSRLARAGHAHCSVRLADMYRLPLAEASFDIAVMQMVLHYAEDPPSVLAEVARVLRPGGRLIVIDLADHDRNDLITKLAHRWPGFSDAAMRALLEDAGMQQGKSLPIDIAARLSPQPSPALRETEQLTLGAQTIDSPSPVMAGLVPAISRGTSGGTDGRDKPGHDGEIAVEESAVMAIGITPSPAERGRVGEGVGGTVLTVRVWLASRATDSTVATARERAV
jgi:hypothetical protein